jgi:GH15 family glucan-1,4-alpha-glucosidase
MPCAIEDYALIGDCETAALVARDGSLDWLCLPRFDSDACFAALLGNPENGRWQLAPVAKAKVRRRYRPGTLILETEFETDAGTATLIDFMPLRKGNPEIVRLVRCDRGSVRMCMDLVIRFDYGRTVPWVTRRRDGALLALAGPHLLVFRTNTSIRGEDLKTVGEFTLTAGSTATFELTYGSSFRPVPAASDLEKCLRETDEWWRNWISQCAYDGPWAEVVERSLITLKALTYEPTGGIVAAPTTSLPEQPGGQRNWDYRFCWLRDATFTLFAFMHAGYHEEAARWRDWLVRSVAGSPDQLQVVYGVAGERHLLEWEVPWLPGHCGATPVRVGNAAIQQLQLDIFGELGDVLHHARSLEKDNRLAHFDLQINLLEYLKKIWRQPDHGIWEVRGPMRHFTHSKVMAWVAFDRAVRSVEEFGLEGPADEWRAIRNEIHDEVCRLGFDAELGSFVQSYGSKEVDASLLLIPIVGFLPPSDPRIAGTVSQIEKQLMRDGFVLRYETHRVEDGLPSGEGAFLACSFWLADNYKLVGRDSEAEQLLKRLLELQNDVGLLAEEYHVEQKRLVGNFPQAFSHVALVNTITNLYTERGPAHRRSRSDARSSEGPARKPGQRHAVP